MKANNKELYKKVFNQILELSKGNVSIEEAKAQANLIKQANNITRYELDRAIALAKYENLEIREVED